MISAQEEWREPGTGAWLGGAEERVLLETNLAPMSKLTAHQDLRSKKIRANRALSKATNLLFME